MLKYKKWVTETMSKFCGQLLFFYYSLPNMGQITGWNLCSKFAIILNQFKLGVNDLEKVITNY